ncbi:MAG: LamG-like jellyroll fold domain-containing protein, partial [Planctomycetota bacterium]
MSKFRKTSLISLLLIVSFATSNDAYSVIIGDLDGNYLVDYRDVRIFAQEWLDPICLISGCVSELDTVEGVAGGDWAVLANNWQKEEAFVVISEFMAANINTLLDGDDQSSDWIEIYNPTDTILNLDGWYLTDDDANLIKWQFPSGVEIDPGEFLIVFASDKKYDENPFNYPYLDPAGYYHTNFNIDQGGEYLGLVAPDGFTVVHEYQSQFPDQLTDVSYGLAQHSLTLISKGATASYHVPTIADSSLGTTWTELSFNDSGWDTGKTGIGFGAAGVPEENLLAYYEFEDNYNDSSGNERHGTPVGTLGFETDPVRGEVLSLPGGNNQYVLVGAVGINGTMPRTIACWAKADHTSIPDWTLIFGFTTAGGGCDSHFNIGSLGGPGGVGAHAWCWEETIFSDEEALEWRHYAMTYDGTTIQYYGDGVLMDTDPGKSNVRSLVHADNVHIGSRATQDSSFPGKVDDACIYSVVLSEEEIGMVMSGSAVGTDVQGQMQNVNPSLWMRIEFEVEDPEFYDMLILKMKYEDGFVAYLNGQKVAEANAPGSLQWNSAALSNRPSEDSSVFTNFNIISHLGLLLPKPQKNVLAIQGLNDTISDDEFLVLPELVIAKNQMVPQYFTTATPGTFNVSGTTDIVEEVWFSHSRGFYDSFFSLTLSTSTKNAEIRYTTDGSRPTATHGSIYSTPLPIAQTTTLRAVAVKPGYLDSDVKTHTYIFVSDVITQSPNGEAPGPGWPTGTVNGQILNYGMDPDVVNDPRYSNIIDDALLAIPSFSLVTDLANMFDPATGIWVNAGQEGRAWERPVSVELIYPSGADGFQIDAGMRIRGGYSVSGNNPKHAFRLFFRSEYGAPYGEGKLRYPLFGDEGVDKFDNMDLRCSQNYSWAFSGDTANTMVREVFSRDVQGMMGHPYTKSRYYHLYVNGHYWG